MGLRNQQMINDYRAGKSIEQIAMESGWSITIVRMMIDAEISKETRVRKER